MRDWTKLLLIVCVVALGAGMFILERRIAGLEAQSSDVRQIATTTPASVATRVAAKEIQRLEFLRERGKQGGPLVMTPESYFAPEVRERQPSGVINGIPYYIRPLKNTEG